MVAIPLASYAYRRESGRIPAINLRNMYFEEDPTNLKSGSALLTRPSAQRLVEVGTGPVRYVFHEAGAFDSDAMVVSATTLSRVSEAGVATGMGALTGGAQPQIATSKTRLMVASGGELQESTGVGLTTITVPGQTAIVSVAYMNGYFLAAPEGSSRIYYLDLLTGEFDASRFVSAERYPDDLVRLEVVGDEIWAFGETSLEIFVATGVDAASQPPFQRIDSRAFRCGLINPAACVVVGSQVYWAGKTKDGGLAFFKGDGQPIEISTPAEAELLREADPDTLACWAFGGDGHNFVVLQYGTGTKVYDTKSGRWTDWDTYGRADWRLRSGCNVWGGTVLAGDMVDGQLWVLDWSRADDDGETITQVFTAGLAVTERPANFSIALDCAVGQVGIGEEGLIDLRHSDDQGRTWVGDDRKSMGATGEYDTRLRWSRLGSMKPPARIWEWTVNGPARLRISTARLNEPV